MSSITSIRNAIAEIKKITDQPHYKKLCDELNYLIQNSNAFDEYINLLTLSKLYISNVKDVVNQLYTLTGNESFFKTKIDSLSNNKTFNYDVIPLNSNKQNKVITYTYFDTSSFDLILSVLRAVSLAHPTDIDNTQFFLPQSTASVNEIAQNITTDYVNTILVERVNINRYLQSIKTNASKLKVTPTPSTTPTSVASNSSKTVDDYIKEFEKNEDYLVFDDVNSEFAENYKKFITPDTLQKDLKDKSSLIKKRKVYKDHIDLVTKYQTDILKFDVNPKYTQKDINETLVGLDKDIQILTLLLNITKGEAQDSKPTPPVSPTVETSPTTPTTPTKPDEKKPEVPLTPEQWGIKFTVAESFATKLGKKDSFSPLFGPNSEVVQNSFYMDLLPARQSTIPVQGGRDVPNAMPGLNYKLVTQVGKQPIPGFSPVYQNLGVKGMQVTIVGAFTGADGDNTRGTDTPIPKDSKDKTPTWINPKGSPSTSDNPGRGGKLPELSAYNSYTEFVQLCQQGKHMEVEINLFQVYKENIASKIGQDIKLQSTNGNPKFNGIVRSLDVYHATKERTWYTLVMDVTDFGMASKDPIDLNNELDEAVKAAQAELNKINQIKKQQETATDIVEESSQNPANETANNALVTELEKNLLTKIESLNDDDQLNSYNHMIRVLKYILGSDRYVFGNYLKGKTPIPFTDYLAKSILNLGKYDDIQFTTQGDNLIVSARVDCETIVFTKVTSTCAYHFYWKIDIKSPNKVITRYWKNRENIVTLNVDRRLFEIRNGLLLNPNYLNKQRYNDNSDMSESEFNNLTKGIIGWNGDVANLIFSRFGGCALGNAAFAIPTFAVAGPPGALAVATSALIQCGSEALGTAIQATQEFNKNAKTNYWDEAISAAIGGFLANLGFAVLKGVGSKVTGGSFRQGAFGGEVIKQGGTVKGGINQISSLIPTLVNKAKANIGKTIKYGNQTAIIDAVDGIPTINGKVAVRLKVEAETRTVPIEDIANELDNIVPSTVTTTTTTDPANPQPPVTPSANVDNLINNSILFSRDLKNYLLGLPENQKLIALKALNEVDSMNTNQILRIELKDKSVVEFTTQPTTGSSGSISGGPDIINVADIESSSLISKPVNPTTPQTPPQQPSSPPQNIPDNESSSPTQQPSSGGGGSQGSTVPTPVGLTGKALDNYKKLFPFNNKQFAEGKELIITLNREVTLIDGKILKPNTQYKITEFIYDPTNNYAPSFEIKNFKWGSHRGYSNNYIDYKDIVDIIIPN